MCDPNRSRNFYQRNEIWITEAVQTWVRQRSTVARLIPEIVPEDKVKRGPDWEAFFHLAYKVMVYIVMACIVS